MIKFFLNKKFWLPPIILVVLAMLLEIFLRLGIYDDFVKPESYLGNALYREKAIKQFGLENIDWITIGDSRMDWGIEHGKLLDIQKVNGLNHLRMSFESSNFMAIQATVDWSIANMPNLKGIMFGFSENVLPHYSAISKQYNVSWPFKDNYDYDKYHYFTNNFSHLSFLYRTAIFVYYKDIRNFFMNFHKRLQQIKHYKTKQFHSIFQYNRNNQRDCCKYQLDTIQGCVNSVQRIKAKKSKINDLEHFILLVCDNKNVRNRAKTNKPNYKMSQAQYQIFIQNWRMLFETILRHNIQLKLVIFPEHHMFTYAIKPNNTTQLVNELIHIFENDKNFNLLDLRTLFDKNKDVKECSLFGDPLHFNNKGKSIITNEIVKSFTNKQTKILNNNIIQKSTFEDFIKNLNFEKNK